MHALNTNSSDQEKSSFHYSLNPADYRQCHPYIYWWVKTVLSPLSRGTIYVDDYRIYRAFKANSFRHRRVQDSLSSFVCTHAQIIQSWSIKTHGKPCCPLEYDDIEKAAKIGAMSFPC